MTRRYGLRDGQWDRIKDWPLGREGHVGRTAKDNCLFVESALYRYRAGILWRALPERFSNFRIIHTRHTRSSKSGLGPRICQALAADADNAYAMIDSTIVRAHQHCAGAKKGCQSRGGLSTKIHVTVDTAGSSCMKSLTTFPQDSIL